MAHSKRYLEYEALRAVLVNGTTTSAAESLGISQSSVSRAIAQLEARTGMTMFDRIGTRLVPTSVAYRLSSELDELFVILRRIETKEWANKEPKSLQIAATPSFTNFLLCKQLVAFCRSNPDIRVLLDTRADRHVWKDLLEMQYDLVLSAVDVRQSGLKLIPFRLSHAVCVMPCGHNLETFEEVHIGDLSKHPLVLMSRRFDGRVKLDKLFLQNGLEPNISAEVTTLDSAIRLVKEGLGISVINPFPFLLEPVDGISARTLMPKIPFKSTFAVSDSMQQSVIVRKFIKFVTNNTPRNFYLSS